MDNEMSAHFILQSLLNVSPPYYLT